MKITFIQKGNKLSPRHSFYIHTHNASQAPPLARVERVAKLLILLIHFLKTFLVFNHGFAHLDLYQGV